MKFYIKEVVSIITEFLSISFFTLSGTGGDSSHQMTYL